MDAKTLYVVGNGFDKQHGIPSDYLDFKAFVEFHDDDVFGWVEEFVLAGEDWAHLETALAELDTRSIIESLEHFMPSYSSDEWSDSGHHDFQYEVESIASGLSLRPNFNIHTAPVSNSRNAEILGSVSFPVTIILFKASTFRNSQDEAHQAH